ncbi:MAG TPA: HD domain-containing protein [Candidatus Saccharimonadales bacterium]|nr:HD domain-containing protein [Candidatus Saccharimonadales bacterium]
MENQQTTGEINMNPGAEEVLKARILPELERGRPSWDKPHTEAVVGYIKEIIKNNPQLNLDADVLITAAYAHDWGYGGLFEAGRPVTMAENTNQKEAHMRIGAKKIEELLNDSAFDYLSPYQKQRIIHLVAVHDDLDALKDPDELVLMEADTLGVADVNATTPTHSLDEYKQWLRKTEEKRVGHFITDYSKTKAHELLAERAEWYRMRHIS